jgi:hypothetical protein
MASMVTTATKFLPFMHQAISNNYPKIRNEPSTPKEIEKIIKAFKIKDLWMRSNFLEDYKIECILYKLTIQLYLQ